MHLLVLLPILAYILEVKSESICEISGCECKTINNSIVSKCSFLQDVPINFEMPVSIKTLDLSQNNLTNIGPINSTTLEQLLLNKNALKELNSGIFNLPELKSLDLSDNLLEKLQPDLFKTTTKLENLGLANNKFSITSQLNFSYLVNLRRINLDNNLVGPDIELRSLFNVTGLGLPSTIQAISINGINLTDIPYDFFEPIKNSLKELSVSNNSLTKFFKLPTSLEYLDISNNPIKILNTSDFPIYEPLVYLRVLKMNNLEIEEVQENIFSYLTLYELELANNKNLKEFSNLTFGREILLDSSDFLVKNITFRGSNLSSLDESLSVLFKRVERLDLQNNPWNCDCSLAWVRDLPIPANLTENLRCAYPRNLYNVNLFDLSTTDFKCPKSQAGLLSFNSGLTVGAVLYILLIIFTLLWIYKFLHKPSMSQQQYSQLI
ncbi:unnamed protein product, partial [Brenthis ino]